MANNEQKKTEQEDIAEDEAMSLTDHLRELKNRLIVIVIVFAIGLAVSLMYAKDIVNLLMAMGEDYGYKFVVIAPQELIMVYVQVALVAGIVIALPVIAYEFYKFAVPALTKKESKAVMRALIFGFVMFIVGVAFAYKISLPFMLYFLINLGADTAIESSISIQEFVSFVLTVFVIFGVVFEMPVITSLLTRIGILKPEYLIKARKIAIVVIFIVAALITPPDIVSQSMVAIPMIGLYEISIQISKVLTRNKKTEEESEEEESSES